MKSTDSTCMHCRGGIYEIIIIIPRDFYAYQFASSWACSPIVAVLKLKNGGILQGSLSLNIVNIVVLIAGHIHIVFGWGSWGITLKIAVQIYYVKSIIVMIRHFNAGT